MPKLRVGGISSAAASGTSSPVSSFLGTGPLAYSDVALAAQQTLDWDPGVSLVGADLELDVDGQRVRVLTPGMYQVFFTPNIMPSNDADGVAQFFLDASANGSPATTFALETLAFPLRPSSNVDPRAAQPHHMGPGQSGVVAGTYSWAPGVFEVGDTFKMYASGDYVAGSAVLMGLFSSLVVVRLA